MVDKCPHYVGVTLLSIFGGNFVLAKVHRGLISVCFSELRGVYGKINRGQVTRLLYRGCPVFGGSVIRGFTIYSPSGDSSHITLETTSQNACRINRHLSLVLL